MSKRAHEGATDTRRCVACGERGNEKRRGGFVVVHGRGGRAFHVHARCKFYEPRVGETPASSQRELFA